MLTRSIIFLSHLKGDLDGTILPMIHVRHAYPMTTTRRTQHEKCRRILKHV